MVTKGAFMTSMFSIIIPVYNVAPYLRECLDSVLAQTYTDWEAICIDDGSTDGSGAILDEYASRDVRFKVFHKENGGVSAARNYAIPHMRGQYVWFVDADDVLHFEALSVLINIFTIDGSIDAICIGHSRGEQCPKFVGLSGNERQFELLGSRNSETMCAYRTGMWSVVHLARNVVRHKFEPFCVGEDVLFNLQVFWDIDKWAHIGSPLYFYRQRNGSACNQRPNLKVVMDFLSTEILYVQLMIDNKHEWKYSDMRGFLLWESIMIYRTFHDMMFFLAKDEFVKAVVKWYGLQVLFRKLHPCSIVRRIVVRAVYMTKSALLGRLLILNMPDAYYFARRKLKMILCRKR